MLADEINRSPAKVQSALLEAMQEHQVTIGDETHPLPDPSSCLPPKTRSIRREPMRFRKPRVDRFMLKVVVDYGTEAEEKQILNLMAFSIHPLRTDSRHQYGIPSCS